MAGLPSKSRTVKTPTPSKTLTRQYRRELSHDGVYAEATLIAEDDGQSAKQNAGDKDEPDKDKNDEDDDQIQQDLPPRNTYIFCTRGNAGSCSTRWTKRPPFP